MSRSRSTVSGWWVLMIVAVSVSGSLVASPAAAGDSPWTIAASVGRASVEGDFGPRLSAWRIDDDATAAGVEVGYRLHRYFGLQAGYHDQGSYAAVDLPCPAGEICPLPFIPDRPTSAEFSAVSLTAVPRWPVTPRVSLYGKVGVIAWDSDLVWPVAPQYEGLSGEDLLAGLGALYAWPGGFGVQLEVETTDLFDQISLGSSWRF